MRQLLPAPAAHPALALPPRLQVRRVIIPLDYVRAAIFLAAKRREVLSALTRHSRHGLGTQKDAPTAATRMPCPVSRYFYFRACITTFLRTRGRCKETKGNATLKRNAKKRSKSKLSRGASQKLTPPRTGKPFPQTAAFERVSDRRRCQNGGGNHTLRNRRP